MWFLPPCWYGYRLKDGLIIVNEQTSWRCNLIGYLLDKRESVEQVVKRITKAVKSSSDSLNPSSGGASEYFDKAFEQLLTNSITLLKAAEEDVTFANIYLLVRNAPTEKDRIKLIKSFKSYDDAKNAPLEQLAQLNFFDSCAIVCRDLVSRSRNVFSAYEASKLTLLTKYPQNWAVDCKAVGSGDKALIYLGRYLYRGVIREKDIVSIKIGRASCRERV